MWKKSLSCLLVIVIAVVSIGGMCVCAEENSIRHRVTGDISSSVVDETAGLSQTSDDPYGSVHTDVFLYVESDSASRITFSVTDEYRRPIENARIYIIYNDIEELYGVTDSKGKCRMNLFRNTEYRYRIEKDPYETVTGDLWASEATKGISVVMRKQYPVVLYILDHDKPVAGIEVYIDGVRYLSDENGQIKLELFNGSYNVMIVTASGRHLCRTMLVDGATSFVCNIESDDSIVANGNYSDRFLVFDKEYEPKDYYLYEYLIVGDGDSVREKMVDPSCTAMYENIMGKYTGIVQIEAVKDETEKTNEGQRSLMPSGYLMRSWEEKGYEGLVFINGNCGALVSMSDLCSGDMAKLYSVLYALTDQTVGFEDIVTTATLIEDEGMANAGLAEALYGQTELDNKGIDYEAVRDSCFAGKYDPVSNDGFVVLPDGLYLDSMFEFRITPIASDAMHEMICTGLSTSGENEILLANSEYIAEELEKMKADGYLTERECSEFYWMIIDNRLSAEEIERLEEAQTSGTLSDESKQMLINAVMEGSPYRISCWLNYRNICVDITGLIPDLSVIYCVDDLYEKAHEQQQQNAERIEAANESDIDSADNTSTIDETDGTEMILESMFYGFSIIDTGMAEEFENNGSGSITEYRNLRLIRSFEGKENDPVIGSTEKPYPRLFVGIAANEFDAQMQDEKSAYEMAIEVRYSASVKMENSNFANHRYLMDQVHENGIYGLAFAGEQ